MSASVRRVSLSRPDGVPSVAAMELTSIPPLATTVRLFQRVTSGSALTPGTRGTLLPSCKLMSSIHRMTIDFGFTLLTSNCRSTGKEVIGVPRHPQESRSRFTVHRRLDSDTLRTDVPSTGSPTFLEHRCDSPPTRGYAPSNRHRHSPNHPRTSHRRHDLCDQWKDSEVTDC